METRLSNPEGSHPNPRRRGVCGGDAGLGERSTMPFQPCLSVFTKRGGVECALLRLFWKKQGLTFTEWLPGRVHCSRCGGGGGSFRFPLAPGEGQCCQYPSFTDRKGSEGWGSLDRNSGR